MPGTVHDTWRPKVLEKIICVSDDGDDYEDDAQNLISQYPGVMVNLHDEGMELRVSFQAGKGATISRTPASLLV